MTMSPLCANMFLDGLDGIFIFGFAYSFLILILLIKQYKRGISLSHLNFKLADAQVLYVFPVISKIILVLGCISTVSLYGSVFTFV